MHGSFIPVRVIDNIVFAVDLRLAYKDILTFTP